MPNLGWSLYHAYSFPLPIVNHYYGCIITLNIVHEIEEDGISVNINPERTLNAVFFDEGCDT